MAITHESITSIIAGLQKGLLKLVNAFDRLESDSQKLQSILGIAAGNGVARAATRPATSAAFAKGTPARPRKARKPGGTPGRKRRRDAAEVANKILSALKGKDKGLSARELKADTKLDAGVLTYRLEVLRKDRKVKMTGNKATARYFAA